MTAGLKNGKGPILIAPSSPHWEHKNSAGLTMWQMWKMPRASGLRGALWK